MIVKGIAESGQKTITLAPEAGSEHMRNIINKGITEEHLLHSIDLCTAAGIRKVRMYIMIGLPMETDDDIQGIVDMTRRVREHMDRIGNKSSITLSINPFIPKPMTPFQWMAMTEQKVVEQRLAYIKKKWVTYGRPKCWLNRCGSVISRVSFPGETAASGNCS